MVSGAYGVKTLLDDLAAGDARAVAADPKTFVDASVVRELESAGFVKRLYGNSKAARRWPFGRAAPRLFRDNYSYLTAWILFHILRWEAKHDDRGKIH
jgi:hypothetical protein